MRPGKDLTGRGWPGSLCRYCTYFIPDPLAETYAISCADCGKGLGSRSFTRHWHDLDERNVQIVLEAEASRSKRAKVELDRLVARARTEKNPKLLQALTAEIERRRLEDPAEPRDFKLRPSWQKRHEESRKNHYCLDCHKKRRSSEKVDFDDVDSHVGHELHCTVCKKVVAYLYISEHHGPAIHEREISQNEMDCTGACSEQAAKLTAAVRAEIK